MASVAMVLCTIVALHTYAATEADIQQQDTPDGKPLFRPQLLHVQSDLVLLAQGEAISYDSGILPQTSEASVYVGILNPETMVVAWQRSEARLRQISGSGTPWSVASSGWSNKISVVFCQLWSSGIFPAYIEIGRQHSNAPYITSEYTQRLGIKGELPFSRLESVSIASISSTQIVAVAEDGDARLWFSIKGDGGSWTRWQWVGVGCYPHVITGEDTSTLFCLQPKDPMLKRRGNLHLVSVPFLGGAPTEEKTTMIGSVPHTPISVYGMDDAGKCLMYQIGNVPYLMLGNESGERWSAPQQVVVSKKLEADKIVSVSSWKGTVFFVVGTESGELYVGRISQKSVDEIPRNEAAHASALISPREYQGVLDENSKRSASARNKAILSIMAGKDTTEVDNLIAHIDIKYDLVVRQNAIRALGAIGDKRALPKLIELLEKPVEGNTTDEGENEAILRRYTVEALGYIGDASALPMLKKLMKSGKEYQSVRDLAEITSRKIEELLTDQTVKNKLDIADLAGK